MEGKLGIVIGVIGLIVAVPQVWGMSWKDVWYYYIRGVVPWHIVHKTTRDVVAKLDRDSFAPTMIVGIGRGGVLCAGLLCSELIRQELITDSQDPISEAQTTQIRLGIINSKVVLKKPTSVESVGRTSIVSRIERIELSEGSIILEPDEKILLIVAQCFTGTTLKEALQIFTRKGLPRDSIKTAAFFLQFPPNVTRLHHPDIYGREVKTNQTMPWKGTEKTTDRF